MFVRVFSCNPLFFHVVRAAQAEAYDIKVKGEENTMDYRAFFNQASIPHKCRCHGYYNGALITHLWVSCWPS